MSYKALKDYFQSCPLQRCSAAAPPLSSICLKSSVTNGEQRKPPKTSLKHIIASWDLAISGSTLDPRKVASSIETTSELAQTRIHREANEFGKKRPFGAVVCETEQLDDDEELENQEIRERNPGSGELLSSGQVGRPLKRSKSGQSVSRTCHKTDYSRTRSDFPPVASEEGEQEDADEIQIVRFEDGEGLGRDSDAGMFAKPRPEGPFEPLVLWPPTGEGSSYSTAKDRIIQVPSSINSRLLEHQREGVLFLYNQYRNNQGGILGDEMGLGKTIQTIAFLAAIFNKDSEFGDSRSVTSSSTVNVHRHSFEKVVLIICPTSVVQNWEQEFNTWGEFQIGIFHGLQRESVLARIQAKGVEIVLTSHDTFRLNGEELCRIKWDCVIIDEAHRLKNHRSQFYIMCLKLPTSRRYGLTGTVMQNRYMELFNVFDWAVPGSLGTREHFNEYYAGPIKQGQRISAPSRFVLIAADRQKHLNILLGRFYLRRTKNETIGHLMKGKEDNVVFCPMSSVQKSVYKRVLQSPDYQALIKKSLPCPCGSPLTRAECCFRMVPDGPIWAYLHKDSLDSGCDLCPYCLVLPCLTKLRQLSNHLELIKPNPKDDADKQSKDFKFAQMALGEDADAVGGVQPDQRFLGLSDAQHCGKMIAVEKLLASWVTVGDKVLLFSDSIRMLDILERLLIRKGYCFSRLDGSIPMSSRQGMVEDFNNSPAKQIFLISTRAGGLGLNLTSANRVVIFDPNWNPAHDLQAQDRSFRFGQNRHVTVFRLLAAGSLEELVYTRQIYKQQLFNIALSGVSEKRYFEGVQGSKQHQGELFGMSNLFRDISEDIFAEDIIENHEDRLVQIHQKKTTEDVPTVHCKGSNHAEEDVDSEDYLSSVETQNESSTEETQAVAKDEDERDNDEERKTQRTVLNALIKSGVHYFHRNENVVNLGPGTLKPKQRLVNHTSNFQNISNKQQKTGNMKQVSEKEMGKTVDELQRIHLTEGASAVEKKEALTKTSALTNRPVPEERKRSMFAQLARFKGMDESEFGKWIMSVTPQERQLLQLDYTKSLTKNR